MTDEYDNIVNSAVDDNIEYAFSADTKKIAKMVQQGIQASGAYNISGSFDTTIVDEYGLKAELTPLSELRTTTTHRLAGGLFIGSTLDTNIYTSTLTSGATATVSNTELILSTNTTLNATAKVETIGVGQYTASNSNMYRGVIRLGDVGSDSNIRSWGVNSTDGNDGYYFSLNNSTLCVNYKKASITTIIFQSQFNIDNTFIIDTNYHVYEIYYKTSGIFFVIDGKLVHKINTTNTPLVGNLNFKPFVKNDNTAVSVNHNIYTMLMTVNRFGELTTNPFYKNLVGAATTTLKQSAGRLHSIVCNNASTAAGQLITIYDNTTATGTKIGTIDLSKLPSPTVIQYNSNGVAFNNGLTLVVAGSAVDITVIYE